MENEMWKPVVGYEGWYEVSNMARVRSVERDILLINGNLKHYYSKIRKWQFNPGNGYYEVSLNKERLQKRFLLHRIVAEVWVEKTKIRTASVLEVNHKDGNKLNPLPNNLEWISVSENIIHAYRIGLNTGNGKTIVDETFINKIMIFRKKELTHSEIAVIMNVKRKVISNIFCGYTHSNRLKKMGLMIDGRGENSKIIQIT